MASSIPMCRALVTGGGGPSSWKKQVLGGLLLKCRSATGIEACINAPLVQHRYHLRSSSSLLFSSTGFVHSPTLSSSTSTRLMREMTRCFHTSAPLESLDHGGASSTPDNTVVMTSRSKASKGQQPRQRQRGKSSKKSNKQNPILPNSKKKRSKKSPAIYTHRTHGPTDRLVLTTETKERMLDTLLSDDDTKLPSFLKDIDWNVAKSLVHNAAGKMLFHQTYTHEMEGPNHDALFFATLRTVLNEHSIAPNQSTPIMELVNTGAAPSKKQAETLAASDLILNLAQKFNIDIRNPPEVAKIKKEQAKEQFKMNVRNAQMILEAIGVSKPVFDTVPKLKENGKPGKGFVSKVSFYCRGTPIRVADEVGGSSKSEAEGRAIITATEPGGRLASRLATAGLGDKLQEIRDLIEVSPAGHVAALHVSPLPDEAIDILKYAMESHEAHVERMERHAEGKIRYERAFHEREEKRRREMSSSSSAASSSGFSDRQRRDVNAEDINNAFLQEEVSRMDMATKNPDGKQGQMELTRDALPIKAIRDGLIDSLKSQQVVVVSGGTGSGKSTQCPQYILEDAIAHGKGAETRIVVTQPRRIAAISVAERIADERGEAIGNSVGFTVRFNKKSPRGAGGSIEFCTTGVLLRRLVNDSSLQGVSHVMIDEVHERDIDTDFLLVLLRDLLKSKPDLRVILMSATLDAESFGKYFSSNGGDLVPVMSVPTKPRHPVEVIYLEDMVCEEEATTTNTLVTPSVYIQNLAQSLLQLHDQKLQLELEEAIAEQLAATRLEARSIAEDDGILGDTDSSDSDDSDNENETLQSLSPPTRLQALKQAVNMRKENINALGPKRQTPKDKKEISEITTKLVAKLAQHVAQEETDAGRKGSILCFLPGLDEIKGAQVVLEEECNSSLIAKMQILPLHSTIPQEDQQKVFIPAPDGTVKIILATNIAESSVTINDVLAVVDGGLVREMNYDAEKSMSMMETVATSKASATQRLGRAGRVAPGKCYRIYSRGQHAAMLERPMPEIQRTSLDATCLNTCTLTTDRVQTFLGRAMDPPKEDAVAYSVEKLKKLGAITADPLLTTDGGERLTPLGQCLSRLPLDPAVGRMLIMGCTVGCLDPVLTAAASFSGRDLFYTPPGMRQEQRRVRQSFSEKSDLVATINAYNDYQEIFSEEGWTGARPWASDKFIGINAINSIQSVRSQLINELNRLGLVHNSDIVRSRGRNKHLRQGASVNRNVGSELLHSAIWSTGLPDNLAGHRQFAGMGTLRTRTENHTGIHPSSVTFHPPKERHHGHKQYSPWIFYREMVLSSQVFLRGCTALTPEQILLFGGYGLDSNGRVLDDWIIIEGTCDETLNLLTAARAEINAALELTVMEPRRAMPEKQQEIIDALCDCFVELESTRQQQEQIPEAYRRR